MSIRSYSTIVNSLVVACLAFILWGPAAMAEDDPYLWLEEVEGEKALDWVRAQNALTLGVLEKDANYQVFHDLTMEFVTAKDRIPYAELNGKWAYNFWRDETHKRGLWRRAKLKSYRTDNPEWETLLDVDALAEAEDERWVYKGEECHASGGGLCMMQLSRGGKDASVYREFNVRKKAFVEGGFKLEEAKSDVTWFDKNTLLVATDLGEGSLTDSGYPRIVKRWARGTPLEDAPILFEADKTDVGAGTITVYLGRKPVAMIQNAVTFFEADFYFDYGGELIKLPIPQKATVYGTFKGQLVLSLEEDWAVEGSEQSFPAGSVLSFPLKRFLKDKKLPEIATVFAPTSTTFLNSGEVHIASNAVYLQLLDNVSGLVKAVTYRRGQWQAEDVPLPDNGGIETISVSGSSSNALFLYENPVTPDSLYMVGRSGKKVDVLKSLPARFDASGLVVHQHEVESKDGVKVPYFVVHKEGLAHDGKAPTLLYGYGGFQISMTPRYSSVLGKLWLERGGVYVLANIRGGGEFGPNWHQAALNENRQKAYDDFYAIAEDLIDHGITSPKHLGIQGGSNGGLLVGVALTQRPELFNAVVCQVPLLDMLRYHKLLAGASWVAEYGDPDIPEEREWIAAYSPYQNVKKNGDYPKTLFYTSTKDDRVHPGHARKMAAKMIDQGHDLLYFEHIEGGHSANANLKQIAERIAQQYVYLWQQLK